MAIERSDFEELSKLISTAVAKALKSGNSSGAQQKSSSPAANRLSGTKSSVDEVTKSMQSDMYAIKQMVKGKDAKTTITKDDLDTSGLQSYKMLLNKSAEEVLDMLKKYEAINMRHLSIVEQVAVKESALVSAREAAAKSEEDIIEKERRLANLQHKLDNATSDKAKASLQQSIDKLQGSINKQKEEQAIHKQEIAARKKDLADKKSQANLEQKLNEDIAKQGTAALKKSAQKRREAEEEIARLREEAADEELSQEERVAKANEANQKEAQLKMLDAAKEAVNNAIKKITETMIAGMNETASYAAKANARLQGLDQDYDDMSWKVKGNLALSPFLSLQKTYENLNEMIHSGIAYNVEYRAFLQTLSEKVAETFDANNATLLRIVRLQQADSTANRLALESTLTEFYNKMYQDSSYLNETFDTVSQALLEASSVMSAEDAVNFEYVVQKWLGALYSLGLSSEGVSSIAQGLGLLGSGNVTALTSNDALNSLFALAASNAGIAYNEMLTEGLTAKDTNDLLKAMVKYLAEIAHNEQNLVVRSAYGDIFSLSQSDFKAISNLSNADIDNIYNTGYENNWSARLKQDSSFSTLFSRTTISEMTDTLINNALYSMGESLGSNPITQVMWKATDLLDEFAAGIPIPSISTMFAGLDLEATASNLMRIGLAGFGLVDTAVSVISALGKGGDEGLASMGRWGATATTNRGTGFTTNPMVGRTGTSGSTVYSAGSGADSSAATVGAAEEDAQKKLDTQKAADAESGEKTIANLYELFETAEGKAYVTVSNASEAIANPIVAQLASIITALNQDGDGALKVDIVKINNQKLGSGEFNLPISIHNVTSEVENKLKTILNNYFGDANITAKDGSNRTYSIAEMAKCIINSFDSSDGGDGVGHLRVADVGTSDYATAYEAKSNGLSVYNTDSLGNKTTNNGYNWF